MGLSEVFQALADPTRREILRLLREGDRTAGELAAHFPLALSTMSGHFRVLQTAGLIVSERVGNRIVYSLNLSALEEALQLVMGLLGVGEACPDSEEAGGAGEADPSSRSSSEGETSGGRRS